jgi:bifunctional DNase/RNase
MHNIYGASIYLDDTYTIAKKKILMIPSHAILLALLANRKVYISRDLVDEHDYFKEKDDFSDDLDTLLDDYDEPDDFDE